MGSARAQTGQVLLASLLRASNPIARTIVSVPRAIGIVRVSPRITMAKKAANTGAVDARMLVSVGPRWRMPAIARLDVRNGRNSPTSAKITTALVPQYHSCKNQGEKSQNNTVDPSIDISAPVWLRPYFSPRLCICTPTANRNADANARTTGVVKLI